MRRLAWLTVIVTGAVALWAWWAGRSGLAMSLFLAVVLVGIAYAVFRGPDPALPGDQRQRSNTSVSPPPL